MPSPEPLAPLDWHAAARDASSALDEGHAAALSRLRHIDRSEVEWPVSASMLILRNFTIEPLDRYVRLAACRRGIDLTVDVAGYDTAEFDVHDPSSPLRARHYDIVVIALWLDEMRQAVDRRGCVNYEAADDYVASVVEGVLSTTKSAIAINTLLPPLSTAGLDASKLALLNHRIHALAERDNRLFVCDLHHHTLELGLEEVFDRRFLLSARAPVRPALHRLWAIDLAQVIASLTGRSKKVLAIDCDNTLWGGIIGEDGLEGIALSPDDRTGRVYYTIQSQLLSLHRAGVLLALCSRNNEEDVWAVLDEHPHCLIEKEMLAAWQINWQDKVSNLQTLSQQMNLALDSFVFLDDSSIECDRVRRALPDVDVIELGSEPAEILRALPKYDGWSRLPVTTDDLARTARYQAEQARGEARDTAESLEEFLAALQIAADLDVLTSDASNAVIARVSQLTQRTNQFNATTRRYGTGEIESFRADSDALVLTLRVLDRFGDYGTVGVAILMRRGSEIGLDTFLLSCRVLGRGIEQAFLGGVVRTAFERWPDAEELRIECELSPKNAVIRRFLREAGLRALSAEASDSDRDLYAADRGWSDTALPPHVALNMPQQFNLSRSS